MKDRIITFILISCVVGTVYMSLRLNNKLMEATLQVEDRVVEVSTKCDSLQRSVDSLMLQTQEDRIAVGRYEYMIELIREKMDSNKVDEILRNVE
jgi:hypothetical protein